jgi:hypothetical protein
VHFEIPDLLTMARHAVPRFIEGSIVPLALFLTGLRTVGVYGAMVFGLGWVYVSILVRVILRRRVPGVLLIGAATLTARTVIALASGSAFVYFLQPSLGTALVASAFLFSVPLNRPLAQKLADDFCPLPPDFHANDFVRRFFRQISLLWAFTQAMNASIAMWLLLTQSTQTFLLGRAVLSLTCWVCAIAASTLWFRHSMARNGIVVALPAFRRRPAAA